MPRLFIITISILFSGFAMAKAMYQIDLILFANPQNTAKNTVSGSDIPLIALNKNAIALKSSTNKSVKPYNLLPPSQSLLKDEYYLLSRKSKYQVLGQYSWRQPLNNQSYVSLPNISRNGWQMEGAIKIIQGTYYQIDADLQFSPPGNPKTSFTVTQKQRIKGDTVHYLDHPQIGMIIKIHKLT